MSKRKLMTLMASASLVASLFTGTYMTANAEVDSEALRDLQRQQQEINDQNSKIEEQIGHTEAQMKTLEEEKSSLETDIVSIQQNIDGTVEKIFGYENEIDKLEEKIDLLNEEIEALNKKIKERQGLIEEQSRSVQVEGAPNNVIDIVLSSSNLSELLSRMEFVSILVNNNNLLMEEQKRDKEDVETFKKDIVEAKTASEDAKVALQVEQSNLLAQRQELDSRVAYVAEKYEMTASERESFLAESQKLADESSKLDGKMQAERDRLIAEEKARQEAILAQQKAEQEARERAAQLARAEEEAKQKTLKNVQSAVGQAVSSSNPVVQAASANTSTRSAAPAAKVETATNSAVANKPAQSSGFIRPAIGGYISSHFGYRGGPYPGFHTGTDIAGSGPILAAKAGTVTFSGWHPYGGGYTVMIDHHDGTSTMYAHMTSALTVAAGQSVSQGQQLGTMGSTGWSTGVHLHFEIRVNGKHVNPVHYAPL